MTPTDDPAASDQSAPASSARRKRDVVITGQFKRDMKRAQKGRHRASVRADLLAVVDLLADDRTLPPHMVDHPLSGSWKNHRDCHIKPDLVLIYRKSGGYGGSSDPVGVRSLLHLVRIGSHSELGLQEPTFAYAQHGVAA